MKKIPDLYFKYTGDDKDNPIFQFNVNKILDYSNDLKKDKIKYLKFVLKKYYEYLNEKFNNNPRPIPEPGEKTKSNHQIILETELYSKITHRIQMLNKFGENVIIDNNYNKSMKRIVEIQKRYIDTKKKSFTLNFSILNIKKKLNSMKNETDKYIYLEYLIEEYEDLLNLTYSNQAQMIEKYKLENDCYYLENGKRKGNGDLTFSELIKLILLPFTKNILKKMRGDNYKSLKEITVELAKNQKITEMNHTNDESLQRKTSTNRDETINKKTMNRKMNTKATNRIEWRLGKTDLIEFFELLYHHNLVTQNTYKNMNIIIRDCFKDDKGNDYDNQRIAKSKSQKPKKSKNFFKVEQVVDEFKNRKQKQ